MNCSANNHLANPIVKKLTGVALACALAFGVPIASASVNVDEALAATATGQTLTVGGISKLPANYNYSMRGKTTYRNGYYVRYDANGYLTRKTTVKYTNCIIHYDALGKGFKYKNREYTFRGKIYRLDANGNYVKGWYKNRFYHSRDGYRLSGVWNIWHSKTAYNTYYFDSNNYGIRKVNFAYKDMYYRAGDGVGIKFGSSEYNRLILQELNARRSRSGVPTLWWSGGSRYDAYMLGCANMAMISYNDWLSCRAHANTNRMNKAFSWRSEYMDYQCHSQLNCATPAAIVNTWLLTTGYNSPLAYRWTHVGIHTIKNGDRFYYTLVLEHNKTVR